MIRTMNVISSIYEVPVIWIYENYLTLPERLTGQDVKIKSVFNARDKTPSMVVYHSSTAGRYKWKCFSTGKQGDALELIVELFHMKKRFDAGQKIINDYNAYILNGGKAPAQEYSVQDRYKLKSHAVRKWTESDAKYWGRAKIGSKRLAHYIVKPLTSFTLMKEGSDDIVIKSTKIYGFFRKDNSLYKIYQPMMKDRKFFKVSDYIQGTDQLTFKKKYLVIGSSLKDIMAFDGLEFKTIECIAPDSENVILTKELIEEYKETYVGICTLFDNDEAGINAMLKYKELYGIPGAHLKLEKDLADCIEAHGIASTRETIYPVLTKALTGTAKQLP